MEEPVVATNSMAINKVHARRPHSTASSTRSSTVRSFHYPHPRLPSVIYPDDLHKIARTLVGSKCVIRTRPKSATTDAHQERSGEEDESGLENIKETVHRGEKPMCDHDYADYRESRLANIAATGDPSQAVYLSMCKSLGASVSSYFLRNLTSERIVMKYQVISPNSARASAVALVDNLHVEHLELVSNGLGHTGGLYIADMLRENFTITHLVLSENSLGSEALRSLCDILSSHLSIVSLNISGNAFDENDAAYIAKLIKRSSRITQLNISHNCFREEGGIHIAQSIVHTTYLEHLDLSWNHLRMRGAVAIADSLVYNRSIKSLNLAWNGLHIPGCKALSKALRKNNSLTELDITCNRIDTFCLKELLPGVKRNTTLQCLRAGSNPLTTAGAISILKTIAQASSMAITELDLSGQSVDKQFLTILADMQSERHLVVHHGIVLSHEHDTAGDDDFLSDDPMTVLMEFMRIQNLRLVDLFTSLDKDGSRSLSYDEFRNGLLSVNIPMSVEAINRLIRKLDNDGDGEVDFSELINGQKEHKRKLQRLNQQQSHLDKEDTELGRISTKIRALIALQKREQRKALKTKMGAGAGGVGGQ